MTAHSHTPAMHPSAMWYGEEHNVLDKVWMSAEEKGEVFMYVVSGRLLYVVSSVTGIWKNISERKILFHFLNAKEKQLEEIVTCPFPFSFSLWNTTKSKTKCFWLIRGYSWKGMKTGWIEVMSLFKKGLYTHFFQIVSLAFVTQEIYLTLGNLTYWEILSCSCFSLCQHSL